MEITKRDMAVLSAFTGIMFGDYSETHEYFEEIIGRELFTHEVPELEDTIHELAREDFLEIEARMRKEAYK